MNGIDMVSIVIAAVSSGIAIYEFAIIRESNKRKYEIQHILAGIHDSALQKQISWQNQLDMIGNLQTSRDWEFARTILMVKDDFGGIVALAKALEGSVDTDYSATTELLKNSIEVNKLNNELQATALKNPNRNSKRPAEDAKQ